MARRLPDQCRANPTITVATVIEFEDVRDDATRVSMPVSNQQPCTVIEVRSLTIKELEREGGGQRQVDEMLRKASAFFAQEELDRRPK